MDSLGSLEQLWSCAATASLMVGNGSYDIFPLLLQAHSTVAP